MDHPSRRPSRPSAPSPSSETDTSYLLDPTPEAIAAIDRTGRPIWSPFHGHGHLVGQIGTMPAFAHVAYYPGLPAGARFRPQHTAAFLVLN